MREPTEVRSGGLATRLHKVRSRSQEFEPGLPASAADFTLWLESYFLGRHPLIREARATVVRAAAESWPVLITGETGTGKDLIARAVHAGSRRGRSLPVVVAVGGLGETAWSILFGHRKGSFTGAVSHHDGVFKSAHGSSILLEDVADLPLRVQPMMLRAIEHGLFRPLGADREMHSDVRVIATCNLPLAQEVALGRFRADLYQRLSVLKIELPPLREHLEDLELYVPHFLSKAAAEHRPAKTMSREAMAALGTYSWPRNVRELEHFLYRASVEVRGQEIAAEDVHRILEEDASKFAPTALPVRSRAVSRAALQEALAAAGGNKREAARRLGVAPGTLYRLLKTHKVYG
jgi:DNA-binding NtrC family response regulator